MKGVANIQRIMVKRSFGGMSKLQRIPHYSLIIREVSDENRKGEMKRK